MVSKSQEKRHREQLDGALHTITKGKGDITEVPKNTKDVLFGLDCTIDNSYSCAKVIYDSILDVDITDWETLSNNTSFKPIKFFVKVGAGGFLYNPHGETTEGQLNREQNGIPMWSFSTVSSEVFNLYMRFLKTRQNTWLSRAENEFRNGK